MGILILPPQASAQSTFKCQWQGPPRGAGSIGQCKPISSDAFCIPDINYCAGAKNKTDCNKIAPTACTDSRAPSPSTTCGDIITAVGTIPTCDLNAFARWFIGWAVGIGGGIAFLLILMAGFRIMSSGGNPDQIKAGKEQLTSAITGLLFIIFSVFLLQLIGVQILHLPGFAK